MSTLDGTLRFAAFALQAQIERLVEILAGEFVRRKLSRKNLAHEVGAAARGVLVFQRHHVRRAHGALILFPANARAVAQLNRRREAAFAREVVMRVDR